MESKYGRVAQWIRRLPTKQKIAGSIPAVVIKIKTISNYILRSGYKAQMEPW